MIEVVLDLKGADNPQEELIKGAVDAINQLNDLFVYAVGDKNVLEEKLKEYSYDTDRISIVDAPDVITNYDKPTRAFKEKPNSSLIVGLNLAREKNCPFLSCGSTGAVLVSSVLLLGKIGNVRPALASLLPTSYGSLCLLDCGANIDTKPNQLKDFAWMGVAYLEATNVSNPRVGLLSNGQEETKGNLLVKETHELFKNEKFNFIGNVEANQVFNNKTDVLVCDGFDGNLLIKSIEGSIKASIKDIVSLQNDDNKEVIKDLVNKLAVKYDYNAKGGAVLLGVNNIVVKGHGACTDETIKCILIMAHQLSNNNLVDKIKTYCNANEN